MSLSLLLNPTPEESPPPRRASVPQNVSPSPDASTHLAQDTAYASNLPAVPAQSPTQAYHSGADQLHLERQRSSDWRPGSGYGDGSVQLPPPPSMMTPTMRKMSSPTLEQYQLASRSPEQRRASIISPPPSNLTLAPLQRLSSISEQQQASYVQPHGHQSHAQDASAQLNPPRHADSTLPPQSQVHQSSHAAQTYISPQTSVSGMPASENVEAAPPAPIKQEIIPTPQPSSPTEARCPSDSDQHTMTKVASLKNEHGLRTNSPLRDSSAPLPSTEPAAEQTPTVNKKRPAPAKTKKGTATTMKKAPPAKKRKVEPKQDTTPSSRTSKPSIVKGASAKGTPANSSPAPSTRSHSMGPNEEPYSEEDEDMDEDADGDVYCICRKPDNGTFMIGCDGTCDDWFHGKCVGIEERDKNLIDKYMCPNCTESGIGRTTWKRMCRRGGCRQPAKVTKTKNGTGGSKYCSEECGVLFFREMVAKTRGREETLRNRASRRKSSIASSEKTTGDDDLGARGGILAAGEVKALLQASKTVEEFKRLGEGVLSPPATPDGKEQIEKKSDFSAPDSQELQDIRTRKEEARARHALLKERLKFVNMVKQAATHTATEKDLKPKDYCGYDSRLEWTEDEFQTWRNSKAGQQALELDTLAVEGGDKTEGIMNESPEESLDYEVCDTSGKKKCSRHLEWAKLAVDDLRMEMSDNGDRMRALDRQEKDINERAALRAKAGNLSGEGTVELHHDNTASNPSVDKMDVEITPVRPLESSAEAPVVSQEAVQATEAMVE